MTEPTVETEQRTFGVLVTVTRRTQSDGPVVQVLRAVDPAGGMVPVFERGAATLTVGHDAPTVE
jgi:hypothetical protein